MNYSREMILAKIIHITNPISQESEIATHDSFFVELQDLVDKHMKPFVKPKTYIGSFWYHGSSRFEKLNITIVIHDVLNLSDLPTTNRLLQKGLKVLNRYDGGKVSEALSSTATHVQVVLTEQQFKEVMEANKQ